MNHSEDPELDPHRRGADERAAGSDEGVDVESKQRGDQPSDEVAQEDVEREAQTTAQHRHRQAPALTKTIV